MRSENIAALQFIVIGKKLKWNHWMNPAERLSSLGETFTGKPKQMTPLARYQWNDGGRRLASRCAPTSLLASVARCTSRMHFCEAPRRLNSTRHRFLSQSGIICAFVVIAFRADRSNARCVTCFIVRQRAQQQIGVADRLAEATLRYFFGLSYTKFLRLHFEPFGSTPTPLSRAERGTSNVT